MPFKGSLRRRIRRPRSVKFKYFVKEIIKELTRTANKVKNSSSVVHLFTCLHNNMYLIYCICCEWKIYGLESI